MKNNEERIQKLISNYGNYSRREAEKFIKARQVKKNGHFVKLGDKATVDDQIEINGNKIKFNLKHDYFLLNKPKGYISKRVDDQQREVISLLPNWKERNLFTVGRLDVLTTGLIIVTNDGNLSNLVQSPRSNIKKTYLVFSYGKLTLEQIKKLKKGVEINDGYITKPVNNFKVIKEQEEGISTYKITINVDKKNQIKKMWESVGSKVVNLKRISIGGLTIDGIELGKYKKLKKIEIYDKLGLKVKE